MRREVVKRDWNRKEQSELCPPFPSSVFGSGLDDLPLAFHLLLLMNDPSLAAFLDAPLAILGLPPRVLDIHAVHSLHNPRDVAAGAADREHQVQLHVLGVRVVLEDTRAEARLDRGLGNHVLLLVVLGVKLADRLAAPFQAGVQTVEEPRKPALGARLAALGVAEPLDGADADGRVERARAEGHALPYVGEQQVALDVPLEGHIQHRRRDVHADPDVRAALLLRLRGQDLAG